MAFEKEEFEDWDGGDYESMFAEAEETDHPEKSKFKPTDRKTVPWEVLCDDLLCTYNDAGMTGVKVKLSTVRAGKAGQRPDHPFIHFMYDMAAQGSRDAWGVLYDLYSYVAYMSVRRFLSSADLDEVQDVVSDTWVSLMEKPPTDMTNFAGLVMRAAEFRSKDYLRKKNKRKVELVSIEDIRNDQGEPMSLDELESPGTEHPWLTATTTETPEGVATAGDLSRLIAKFGNEVGPDRYAVFCAVEVDGTPIANICREFNVDQSTAYRWIAEVRSHVRDRLIEEGYEL